MGRRSKRLRCQLHQYALDEAGSYSLITQWQPPLNTQPQPRLACVSKRCVVVSVLVVVVVCFIASAVGVGVVLLRQKSSGESTQPPHTAGNDGTTPGPYPVKNPTAAPPNPSPGTDTPAPSPPPPPPRHSRTPTAPDTAPA